MLGVQIKCVREAGSGWVGERERKMEEVDTGVVGEWEATWRRRAMHWSCPKLSRDQKIITTKADNSNLTQHCKTLSSFCQLCILSSFLLVGEGNVTQLVKNWLHAFGLLCRQSSYGWKMWQIQLVDWCIKVNVSNIPVKRPLKGICDEWGKKQKQTKNKT